MHFLRWALLLSVEDGRVFAASKMLHAGLHERRRGAGAGKCNGFGGQQPLP